MVYKCVSWRYCTKYSRVLYNFMLRVWVSRIQGLLSKPSSLCYQTQNTHPQGFSSLSVWLTALLKGCNLSGWPFWALGVGKGQNPGWAAKQINQMRSSKNNGELHWNWFRQNQLLDIYSFGTNVHRKGQFQFPIIVCIINNLWCSAALPYTLI